MQLAQSEERWRKAFKAMCFRDPLFYARTFLWTLDTKTHSQQPNLPFVFWPAQETVYMEVLAAIGKHDLVLDKSRDEGGSFLVLAAFDWCWRFRRRQLFLLGSRKQEYVDDLGNPRALFTKLDYINEFIPKWLTPRTERKLNHLKNLDNGSVIEGESCNPNFARGDRPTAIMLDEFAAVECDTEVKQSTGQATSCCIYTSTHKGTGTEFHSLVTQNKVRRVILDWSEDPRKNPGLYISVNGKLKILDNTYNYPENYPFRLDGKLRSPWMDKEEDRATTPAEIEQEVRRNPLANESPFFDEKLILDLQKEVMHPAKIGEIKFRGGLATDADSGATVPVTSPKFQEEPGGRLHLWVIPDYAGRVPGDRQYKIGADVAEGTGDATSPGATPSIAAVWDALTGEKVAVWRGANEPSFRFAAIVAALAKWFNDAEVIWEALGPGRTFGRILYECRVLKLWREQTQQEAISPKRTPKLGFYPTSKEKRNELWHNYRRALQEKRVVNRSKNGVDELRLVKYHPDGKVGHVQERNKRDPSKAKENHADEAVADALAVKLLTARIVRRTRAKKEAPFGSLEWRDNIHAEQSDNRARSRRWRVR